MGRRRSKIDSKLAAVLAKRPWDEEDARVALEAFEDSGMGVAAFARQHGFTRDRLSWWRRKLGPQGGRVEGVPALVPVRVVKGVTRARVPRAVEPVGAVDSGVEVVVRGARRVRLSRGFDAETLYRAVEVLEVFPC